jgi:transcriptional regulator with XRE-family HTH domain
MQVSCKQLSVADRLPFRVAGRVLRFIREVRGLEHSQLAAATSLSVEEVRAVERGEKKIDDALIGAFADALNVPVNQLAETLLQHYQPLMAYWLNPDKPSRCYSALEEAEALLSANPLLP